MSQSYGNNLHEIEYDRSMIQVRLIRKLKCLYILHSMLAIY